MDRSVDVNARHANPIYLYLYLSISSAGSGAGYDDPRCGRAAARTLILARTLSLACIHCAYCERRHPRPRLLELDDVAPHQG